MLFYYKRFIIFFELRNPYIKYEFKLKFQTRRYFLSRPWHNCERHLLDIAVSSWASRCSKEMSRRNRQGGQWDRLRGIRVVRMMSQHNGRISIWGGSLQLAPPPPNIVEYKIQPQLCESTQIYNLSLKSPPPNIWVRTQTTNLSMYSKFLRYLCTFLKFVLNQQK